MMRTNLEKGVNSLERKCGTGKNLIVLLRRTTQECHLLLMQNLHSRKIVSIMRILEKMDEIRMLNAATKVIDDKKFSVCYEQKQTVEHLVAI